MEFSLLFTLTLGSFLMVLPYLSEALTVDITMPSYSAMNTQLEVKCAFTAEVQATPITLLHGDSKTVATYLIKDGVYSITPNNKITLTKATGTTVTGGTLIFTISRLACSDFTWYMCQAVNQAGVTATSKNETLKVFPTVDNVQAAALSNPTVHQLAIFTCGGTVSKEGPVTVKWYHRNISPNDQLQTEPAKVISTNDCHRKIQSSLSYNVSEADIPSLILWCQIDGEKVVQKMGNFTVQELTTVAAPITPQAVKAGLDAGSIVGIVLGITAVIVLVVLLVWFLVIRPKRLKADGPAKEQGPEPNAKDYQVQDNVLYATVDPLKKFRATKTDEENMKGEVNPALEDKHDADNAPYTVYPPSKYEVAPGGGHENPAMDDDMPNHMSGSTV